MAAGRATRAEAGTTLIELLVAVAIMGIAFLAILGGIGTSILGANLQRKNATAGIVLSSAAEQIVGDPYQACALPGYTVPSPAGFTIEVTVRFWNPPTNRFEGTCPATDSGLQLIALCRRPVPAPSPLPACPAGDSLEVVKRQVVA